MTVQRFVVLILIVFQSGCGNSAIEVILPNGYKGEFNIIKDAHNGETNNQRASNMWFYEIPKNGRLRVADDSPFFKWHVVTFRFVDGTAAKAEFIEVVAGSRQSGPNSYETSTAFDGTTHRWRIAP